MKRFVKKLLLFALIFCVTILTLDVLSTVEPFRKWIAYLTESKDYYYPLDTKNEVRDIYLGMIREEGDYTKLVVGDSVCNQMLNDLHDLNKDYCIVGNNRALTLAGEYLLIQEFFEYHEGVTDVYLIIGFDMLMTNIDETFGYSYVVAPFAQEGMLENLEEGTLEEIRERFGTVFTQNPVVGMVERSAVNQKLYLNYLKDQAAEKTFSGDLRLSEVAARYLVKINELCEEKGAVLHLLPDPLSGGYDRHIQAEMLRADFEYRGLQSMFPNYFEEVSYYPEEQFGDGVHFGEPYNTREALNQKVRELYLDRGYLEGLVLEE